MISLLGVPVQQRECLSKSKNTQELRRVRHGTSNDKSNNCKADRIYINAFKEHLPESVRDVLKMDRWNDKGTWLKEPKK